MPDPHASTMRRDVISAYILTLARIASWIVVSAIVFRRLGPSDFAIVALIRSTVGLLSYVSFGIGPAIIRLLSIAEKTPLATLASSSVESVPQIPTSTNVLGYARDSAPPKPNEEILSIYVTGERIALALGLVGLLLTAVYSQVYSLLHEIPDSQERDSNFLVLTFGVGIVLRMISDAPSALLQVRGRIAVDNAFAAATEMVWAAVAFWAISYNDADIYAVGSAFLLANLLLLTARAVAGRLEARSLTSAVGRYNPAIRNTLLSFGLLVTVAQLADFLYAPVDYILINRLINPDAVAIYAPAVHIDAALLLLVTGLATVLLPKAAIAHAGGDIARVRRYYLRGTLATAAMLIAGAIAVWMLSPWIFRLWLGDEMSATRAILPLVLIHTVVGGSSAVGRSILLGMGKVHAFTIAVLVTGVSNVILGYIFVRWFDLGLRGIVFATIIVVVARAGVWMPWYVLRSLRHGDVPAELIEPVIDSSQK